jgi:hypothetical protein
MSDESTQKRLGRRPACLCIRCGIIGGKEFLRRRRYS